MEKLSGSKAKKRGSASDVHASLHNILVAFCENACCLGEAWHDWDCCSHPVPNVDGYLSAIAQFGRSLEVQCAGALSTTDSIAKKRFASPKRGRNREGSKRVHSKEDSRRHGLLLLDYGRVGQSIEQQLLEFHYHH